MAYSYQEVISDGSLTTLGISIGFTAQADITVLYDGELLPTGTNVGRNWVWSDAKIITFRMGTTTTAIPNGVVIRVDRNTSVQVIRHVFSVQAGGGGSAKFTNSTMDENFQQFLYTAQESVDRTNAAIEASDDAVAASANAMLVANAASVTAGTANTTANAANATAGTALTNANTAIISANDANDTADAAALTAAGAVTTANAATTTAGNAVTTANAAVTTANAASTTAGNAVTTANTANTNASNAVSTANTANTTAGNALTVATGIEGKADQALADSGTALTTANAIAGTANTALSNSATALTAANTANTNAGAALTTANSVASTAEDALDAATEALDTANTAAGAIAGKVNRTGDTFTGKVYVPPGGGLNLGAGDNTAPEHGDIWVTDSLLHYRGTSVSRRAVYTGEYAYMTKSEAEGGTSGAVQYISALRLRQGVMAAPVATTAVNGLMASTDKLKLDGVEAGAQVNTVTSVAGRAGAVVLDGTDIKSGTIPGARMPMDAGGVGTLAFVTGTNANFPVVTWGNTIAGSRIEPVSLREDGTWLTLGTTLSGTWRVLGAEIKPSTGVDYSASLVIRIS